MKKYFLLLLCLSLTTAAWPQGNYRQQYRLLSRSGDDQVVRSLLEDWQRAEPQSDQVQKAWFDHLVQKALVPVMQISRQPVRDAVMSISDSLGNRYYYYTVFECNDSLFNLATEHLDRAISLAPDRIDYRMERIGVIEAAGLDAPTYAAAVLELVERNALNGGRWKNEEGTVGTEEFIDAVQQSCGRLLTLEQPAISQAERIADAMLKQFPGHPMFLADLGTVAFMKEDYRTAEKYYAKAYKEMPGDMSLLRNLAITCRKSGKVKQAVSLLERLKREGSAEDAAFAQQYLDLIEIEK